MRWNYTNGEIYLTSFHACLAFVATLIVFGFLRSIISGYLKKVLISFTNAHKKQHAIIARFVLKIFFLTQYIAAALIASFFVKENSITEKLLNNTRTILITFLVVYLFSGIVRIFLENKAHELVVKKSSNASFIKFANKIVFIVFWLIAIAYIL